MYINFSHKCLGYRFLDGKEYFVMNNFLEVEMCDFFCNVNGKKKLCKL